MTESHVSTFVVGRLNNVHNACCNVRQIQDSLSRNGKIVVLLTLFMNFFAVLYRTFLANFEPALQCFQLLIFIHSLEACTFWFLFLYVYPCRGHYSRELVEFVEHEREPDLIIQLRHYRVQGDFTSRKEILRYTIKEFT